MNGRPIASQPIRYAAVGLLLAALTDGCESGTAPRPEPAGIFTTAIVSNPLVPLGEIASGTLGAELESGTTYVSFRPGTFSSRPGGWLTIRNVRTGESVTEGLLAGGLDPVAILAEVDDTLTFTVDTGGGPPIEFIEMVPGGKRPTVVRTDPQPGKRDVPLNIQLRVVFSEPVNPATVIGTTLMVAVQGRQVDGDLEVSTDGLQAIFRPAAFLLPQTDYTISVGTGILDLEGDPLEEPVIAGFTTAPTASGPVPASEALVFEGSDLDIHVINADGSFLRNLTPDGPAYRDSRPVWSPAGDRIALWRSDAVYVVNPDGTNLVRVSPQGIYDFHLAWSPDGRQIAFDKLYVPDDTWHINVANADGSNLVSLTPLGASERLPAWSPDGQRIYFVQIPQQPVQQVGVMNADGTNRVTIATLPDGAVVGPWSPDRSKLAFSIGDDIYVLDTSSGNAVVVADSPTGE
ncbi:MAG TPA: Ig-like domain-containing protein, partial [Gemmatimonadales bacterium]|nr:Ig-like domain-containing protein [Gemmatimonadales bacterium]